MCVNRSLSGARKTCNRLLEDCRRIADCDPLQALYEQEPLAQRAEDVKAACKGLPSDPLVTPSICSVQLHDIDEHLQALMTGLAVTMSLDPRDQQEEGEGEGEDVTVNSLHAQDTQGTEDQSGGGVNGSKLDSTFLIDPSPSLASPSTPPSYSTTPHYHTSLGAHYSSQHTSHSPNSEDSPENSTGEEFKDIRLRPPVPFLRTSHGFWSDYHIHGRSDKTGHEKNEVMVCIYCLCAGLTMEMVQVMMNLTKMCYWSRAALSLLPLPPPPSLSPASRQ